MKGKPHILPYLVGFKPNHNRQVFIIMDFSWGAEPLSMQMVF